MANFSGAPSPAFQKTPRDRYDRYLIPGYPLPHPLHPGASGKRELKPEDDKLLSWTRVSTIAGTLGSEHQIDDWRLRLAIKGVGIRPDLYALAAATPLDDKDTLQGIAKQAVDAAEGKARANLGTALHSFSELADSGEDLSAIPYPWRADIEAYQAEMQLRDIELIPGMTELRVINPKWADGNAAGVAGRFDRIVMYKGRPTIGDLKSGSDPLRYGASKIAIQLWLYATAWAIWDGAKFLNLPKDLNTDIALVFHVPPGESKCEIHELPLDGCEDAVRLALDVRAWRREKRVSVMLGAEDEAPVGKFVRKLKQSLAQVPKTKVQQAAEDVPPFTPDEPEPEGRPGPRTKALRAAKADLPEQTVIMDGTGKKPVAPLAAEGQMGCSVCRRTGHRKGSPKCLGQDDPALSPPLSPVDPGTPADLWMMPWTAEAAVLPPAMVDHDETPDNSGAAGSDTDPFEGGEDGPDPDPVDWDARISDCTSKAQLQALRHQAKEMGVWNNDLLGKMVARLEQIK